MTQKTVVIEINELRTEDISEILDFLEIRGVTPEDIADLEYMYLPMMLMKVHFDAKDQGNFRLINKSELNKYHFFKDWVNRKKAEVNLPSSIIKRIRGGIILDKNFVLDVETKGNVERLSICDFSEQILDVLRYFQREFQTFEDYEKEFRYNMFEGTWYDNLHDLVCHELEFYGGLNMHELKVVFLYGLDFHYPKNSLVRVQVRYIINKYFAFYYDNNLRKLEYLFSKLGDFANYDTRGVLNLGTGENTFIFKNDFGLKLFEKIHENLNLSYSDRDWSYVFRRMMDDGFIDKKIKQSEFIEFISDEPYNVNYSAQYIFTYDNIGNMVKKESFYRSMKELLN